MQNRIVNSMSKQKLHWTMLNRQGRLYLRLLQWGSESKTQYELNSTETKGYRVFKCLDDRKIIDQLCLPTEFIQRKSKLSSIFMTQNNLIT